MNPTHGIGTMVLAVLTACPAPDEPMQDGSTTEDGPSTTATASTITASTVTASTVTASTVTASTVTASTVTATTTTTTTAATGDTTGDTTGDPMLDEDWSRDILSTDLEVDLSTMSATATIVLAPSDSTAASFEIGDLEIIEVRDASGPLPFEDEGDTLDVQVPASDTELTLEIDYQFAWHDDHQGAASVGVTYLWPYFCGNLYPCKSDPSDGLTFSMSLLGIDPADEAIYPASIDADAPSYQIAWAVGEYQYIDLGSTTAGTQVGVWHLPGSEVAATNGTASLRDHFDWFETTYGPYLYGPEVASVEASNLSGGMEHHPLWHVGSGGMASRSLHAHEAAHGWFGGGVRITCWEDFVLSEGTVSYLTARAVEQVDGLMAADALWTSYENNLQFAQQSALETIAWPQGCGRIDILQYFSLIPYMKGAFFYRALEQTIGRAALDQALANVYADYAGRAAGMQDLLDEVQAVSGHDPGPCAQIWLRAEALPADIHAACP